MKCFSIALLLLLSACGRIGFDPLPGEEAGSAQLASLELFSTEPELIVPAFDPTITSYSAELGLTVASIEVTATAVDPTAEVEIKTVTAGTGVASGAMALGLGVSELEIIVTTTTGDTSSYQVAVSRADSIAQEVYLKASNTGSDDNFGRHLSLWGDTLAVGAFDEDSSASGVNGDQMDNSLVDAGAVYIFTRSGETWTQEAYLKASNPGSNDNFGRSVSLWGDTLAVGAINENGVASNAGAVYVFTRNAGTWTQEAYLKASNAGLSDEFGRAVSLYEDMLAVGAQHEASASTGVNGDQTDDSAQSAGAAYVFTRSAGQWTQEAYLKASNAGAGDQFGESLSLHGDTLAISAHREDSGSADPADNSAIDAGALYIFRRKDAVWAEEAYLKASNPDGNDLFGRSISLWGDTLAVGAHHESSSAGAGETDNGADKAGAAYVYRRSDGIWSQEALLKAANAEAGDRLGFRVAVWGDSIAVGAVQEDSDANGPNGDPADNSADAAGAAYLFSRAGTTWIQDAYIKASNSDNGDQFGRGVTLWGDTLVIGATQEDSGAQGPGADENDNALGDSGAVYVFQ